MDHQNLKFQFKSKVMMKKLLKINEIAALPKGAQFSSNHRYRSQILITQIEGLNEDCIKISLAYLLYFPKNNPSNSVAVGPGRFIVLNDSARSKFAVKMCVHF